MATLTDVEIPNDVKGIAQPRLKHKWRINFQGIGTNVDSQDLTAQAVTVTRPSLQFEEVTLNRYNSKAFVAGKHEFQPMNLTIEDDINGRAASVIQSQIEKQQKLIAPQPGQFLASSADGAGYKFAITIDALDGGATVLETWKCEGCWIQNAEYGDFDYSASEAMQITLTIRFDHASQSFNRVEGGQAFQAGKS
jgi:hypothetical protein